MDEFLLGLLVMACAIAGLFFLRFWRKSRDRLFIVFAVAFWLMAVNWLLLAWSHLSEPHTSFYLIRLVAYVLILLGIWDKNRAQANM